MWFVFFITNHYRVLNTEFCHQWTTCFRSSFSKNKRHDFVVKTGSTIRCIIKYFQLYWPDNWWCKSKILPLHGSGIFRIRKYIFIIIVCTTILLQERFAATYNANSLLFWLRYRWNFLVMITVMVSYKESLWSGEYRCVIHADVALLLLRIWIRKGFSETSAFTEL